MAGMSWWTITIYGGAAVLAVQGLLALMLAHHRYTLKTLMDREIARREAEAAEAAALAEAAAAAAKKANRYQKSK
jgi:hypothetical protein